jgi:proteasome lid subunit RPN8/RPN11
VRLLLPEALLRGIEAHGELSYPHEGAGLLLGTLADDERRVKRILPLPNEFEESNRNRRYRVGPKVMMQAEDEADRLGMTIVGIFHSHPDHLPVPSAFDREWALPWFDYLITSVEAGTAGKSRLWRLREDRGQFDEIALEIERPEEVA